MGRAQVDEEKLTATVAEADSMKNRIGFGLTKGRKVLIDRVRVYENEPREDGGK